MGDPRRDSAIEVIEKAVENRAAEISVMAASLIPKTLKSYGVDSHYPSIEGIDFMAYNCAKDLEKIAIYQKDQVDPLKTYGYFGFWIRKVKPIEQATRYERPFKEVNEWLSLWVVVALVTRHYREKAGDNPVKRDYARHISQKFTDLLNDPRRTDYLIHCLRSRTFGPHHYVFLLQQMVYGL